MKKISKLMLGAGGVLALGLLGGTAAYAQLTADSQLTQEITAGTMSTSIRDAAGAVVTNPSFAMSAVTASTAVQTSTGTFGDDAQRITVDNPGVNSPWSLALAASAVGNTWGDGGTNTYPYNAATSATGQLTVNPAAATITTGATGISLGTQATYVSGTVDSVTLMTATTGAPTFWNGYLTGAGLSQTIPSGTPAGNYTLDMTQTLTIN